MPNPRLTSEWQSVQPDASLPDRLYVIPTGQKEPKKTSPVWALAAGATCVSAVFVALAVFAPRASVAQELSAVQTATTNAKTFLVETYGSPEDAKSGAKPISRAWYSPSSFAKESDDSTQTLKDGLFVNIIRSLKLKVTMPYTQELKLDNKFKLTSILPSVTNKTTIDYHATFRGKVYTEIKAQQVYDFYDKGKKIPQTRYYDLIFDPQTKRVVYSLVWEPHLPKHPYVITYGVTPPVGLDTSVPSDYRVYDVRDDAKLVEQVASAKPQTIRSGRTTLKVYGLVLDYTGNATLLYKLDPMPAWTKQMTATFKIEGLQDLFPRLIFRSQSDPAVYLPTTLPFGEKPKVWGTVFRTPNTPAMAWPVQPRVTVPLTPDGKESLTFTPEVVINVYQFTATIAGKLKK